MIPPPVKTPPFVRGMRAFTLVELLVTIIIFVMLILGIAVMFRSTSRAVGVSEASLEMLSNVRAAQDQMARDFASFDRTTFMIIRHRKVPRTGTDSRTAPALHVDQVAFIANGNFPYKTPGDQTPLSDQTAHAALVWYGHLVVEGVNWPNGNTIPKADQSQPLMGSANHRLDVPPSGVTASDFILGRHATLLLAPNVIDSGHIVLGGKLFPAYPTPSIYGPAVDVGESKPAHITSSRLAVAAITPGELMQQIKLNLALNPEARSQSGTLLGPPPLTETSLCYRFKTLLDPWSTEVRGDNDLPSLANAAARMSPIFLRGVESFEVELGDGVIWTNGGGKYDAASSGDDSVTISSTAGNSAGGAGPTAVRITLRVTDPTHRLAGGRVFQQVIHVGN